MSITMIPRLTVAEQMARKPENRGKPLAVDVRASREIRLRASEVQGKSAQEMEALARQAEVWRRMDLETLGIKTVKIPPGRFVFQRVSGVWFSGCEIATTKFTNGQFLRLLKAKPDEVAKTVDSPADRLEQSSYIAVHERDAEQCPMLYLDNQEAAGIAGLVGGRLLEDIERERAAAGTCGRVYPFGLSEYSYESSKLQGLAINRSERGVVNVYQHGYPIEYLERDYYEKHPHRDVDVVYDLAGNANEWTRTSFGEYDLSDLNNPKPPKEGEYLSIRGGSWVDCDPKCFMSTCRAWAHKKTKSKTIGFRIARDLSQVS